MPKSLLFTGLSGLLLLLVSCSGAKEVEPPAPEVIAPATQPTESAPEQTASPDPAGKDNQSGSTAGSQTSKPEPTAAPQQDSAKPSQSKQAVPSEPPVQLSAESQKKVAQIRTDVEKEGTVKTQNNGLTTVRRILLAQQAQWLISGSFTTKFEALEPNLPQETDEYKFEITKGDANGSVIMAIAKSEKLPSYTGATFAVPQKTPMSGLCQTKLPSKTAPTAPRLESGKVYCANEAIELPG